MDAPYGLFDCTAEEGVVVVVTEPKSESSKEPPMSEGTLGLWRRPGGGGSVRLTTGADAGGAGGGWNGL